MKIKQWWQSKPYWLKGGLLGVFFVLILWLYTFLTYGLSTESIGEMFKFFAIPGALAYFLTVYVIGLAVDTYEAGQMQVIILTILFSLPFYLLMGMFIGSIFGLIINKFKK